MSSLKSRLFIFVLRYQNLLRFQWKRKPFIDCNTFIPDLRKKTEKAGRWLSKMPAGIQIVPAAVTGLYAEWIRPDAASGKKAILYFHGGGYVIGSARGHRPHVAKVVKGSGVSALVFDYRLAPEYPYPSALEDATTAYRFLLADGRAHSDIIFMGDSAGGGLCLATMLKLKDEGVPLPAAAVALSPWTDLKATGESLKSNEQVDLLTWRDSWTIFSKYYAGDHDPALPWISPLYGDLHGLPPLLIYVGGDELLRDDSTRFAEKAHAAGVEVTLRIGAGLFHCYPVCSPLFPEAKLAMDEICAFIRMKMGLSPLIS